MFYYGKKSCSTWFPSEASPPSFHWNSDQTIVNNETCLWHILNCLPWFRNVKTSPLCGKNVPAAKWLMHNSSSPQLREVKVSWPINDQEWSFTSITNWLCCCCAFHVRQLLKDKIAEQGPRVRRVGENISAEQLLEGVFRFIYSLMECAPNLVGRRWQ